MNIYVGNLSFSATEEELRQAFEAFGRVDSTRVIKDAATGRSRGFGFVEMADDTEARAAIEALNGSMLAERSIRVNEGRGKPQGPRQSRRSGGGPRTGGGTRGPGTRY